MYDIKRKLKTLKNDIGDYLINLGADMQTGMWKDNKGSGSLVSIVMLVIGIVFALKMFSTQAPQAISDWNNATTTGALASASDSDKATWNFGGTIAIFGAVIFIAGLFFKK